MAGLLWPVKPMKRIFPAFFAADQRLDRAVGPEHAPRIGVADHLVHLHQIDDVGAEIAQALIDLRGRGLARPPVDLRHQEDALAVAVAQRLPIQTWLRPSL